MLAADRAVSPGRLAGLNQNPHQPRRHRAADVGFRVVAAVSGGLSRRQAAERFGVSAASAVRWCSLEREQGDAKPKPMGGDRYSHRIEAHAVVIL